jgi:hypothetical protein
MSMKSGGPPGRPHAFAAWSAVAAVALLVSACVAATASPSGPAGSSLESPSGSPTVGPSATATFVGDCCAPPSTQPNAMVTPRPSRDAGSAPVTSAGPTSASTPADAPGEDGTNYFDKTVPARRTISVPIDFEGSSWGTVAAYTKSNGLTVTFHGKTLTSQETSQQPWPVWSFGVSMDNPANGDLTIKNTTGSPVEVAGYAMIYTRRHLTIEPSSRFMHKGQEISIDVSLTQATAADSVTVAVADTKGNSTPISVTRVGTGHWTGHATFSAVGDFVIRASTSGSRMRTAMSDVQVSAGDVTLSSTFAEQLVDSDHDGLANELRIASMITVRSAGNYMANAQLVDQTGFLVATAVTGEIQLVAGTQPLSLEFDGYLIYKAGRWGPYTVEVTIVHETTTGNMIEVDDARLGQTAAYDYMQFQHDRIAVDPASISSKAVDTNGDGLFDELDLSGTVTVETPGLYAINSALLGNRLFGQVASEYMTFQLAAGASPFTIVYKGSDIAASGVDGPYTLLNLDVYLNADPMSDNGGISLDYTTAAYKASQFSR